MVEADTTKPEEVPKEETTATSAAAASDKTPEQLAAEKEAKKEAKDAAKAANKAARDAKKNERLRARQEAEAKKNEFVKDPNDPCADKFGELPLNRSQCDPELRFTRKYVAVKDLGEEHAGKEVRIRGRLSNSRAKGKMCFVVIREAFATAQAVLFVSESISKGMVTFSAKIPKESIIEIVATATVPDQPIPSVSQQIELQVTEIWCVNKSVPILPFQIEDASRVVLDQEAEYK